MSDRLSKFIQNEIDQINTHLPVKTLSMRVLEKMDDPKVKTRDGNFIRFESKELDWIKNKIPERYWGHILLPIIITRRRDLGKGAFVVGGSEVNLFIIQTLFDEMPSFKVWKADNSKDKIFYRPHIKTIRKKLPTTTIIAFS